MADEGTDNKKPIAPTPRPAGAQEVLKKWLRSQLIEIEQCIDKDVLVIFGPIEANVPVLVRVALENIKKEERRDKLLVILTTGGGLVEVAQTIVNTLRQFYGTVEFLVPSHAMSAGTVLVMSGDAIYMDYFSRLGPIDPQIYKDGNWIPALSYLRQYNQMKDKEKDGTLTAVDMVLFEKMDLAVLDSIELAKNLSVSLITEWLSSYKFKDWTTDSKGNPVDDEKRRKRAAEIAEKLNNQEKWFVHGHGIHMDVLRHDLNLVIDDYSKEGELKSLVWKYWWIISENYSSLVHSREFI